GSFEAQFDATPNAANMDGVLGLSNGPAAAWTDLAAGVRFNTTGTIDARNAGAYAATATIPYSAATTYHFRLDVNVPAHSYTIYVTPAGATEQLLGSNFAFRSEQSTVSVLNNLGVYADVGSATACNLAISAGTPLAPAPVASVTVSPASASVQVGATQQLLAVTKDAAGTVLTGRVVTWASSASLVAAVTGTGLVTGLALGAATITATSEGQSGTAAITVTVLPPPSGAAVYVAPAGNDAVSCVQAQNIGTPKQTVNNAVGCLTPGSTLLIRGGTYAEELLGGKIPSGTSWSAAVTLKAYPGETVTLQPTAGASRVITFVNNQSYIVIDGLILDGINVAYDVVKLQGGNPAGDPNHIRISNSEIKNAPMQGILDSGQYGNIGWNEYLNLKVHDNGGTSSSWLRHGFYIGTPHNLITGCDAYRNSSYGIQIQYAPAAHNTVRNNKSHDNLFGGIVVNDQPDSTVLYNNLVYNNPGAGIQVTGAHHTSLDNNTVYGVYTIMPPGSQGAAIYISSSDNTTVQNNVSFNSGVSNYYDGGTGTVQDHNLFGVDPIFVNLAAGDFHLPLGSPAINIGTTISMVPTDFDAFPRPYGVAYDIGAYEWHP
ncbi:MAG TPA: right-handed parallel beta-helix repeat-containing protein, partial [Acidimicrobiales bacterium]